jgi:starch synthase
MFATAELSPLCRVGGLADASAGLVAALRRHGADVEVVVPDHGGSPGLVVDFEEPLELPEWAGPAVVRYGTVTGLGKVIAVRTPSTSDIHPYNDPGSGLGWGDNDLRYLAFSAAVAALAVRRQPDVVHLNDWHTAAAAAWIPERQPVVLTIHNLTYQGECAPEWLDRMGPRRDHFANRGMCNPLAGGIGLADRVVAVSPSYAAETRRPGRGDGLDDLLRSRSRHYSGIRNGIDMSTWDPATDPYLPAHFSWSDLSGKNECRVELLRRAGLPDVPGEPVVGMVCRFVDQKGIDTALSVASQLRGMPARLVLMGRGEAALEAAAVAAWVAEPLRIAYLRESSEALAHLVIAGSDLLLVPSRFEPCGLTPMEAMRCGTIPVVTPVGGLRDSVIDASGNETHGNGFIAPAADAIGVSLALSRAIRAWSSADRRADIRRSGMTADWSWRTPARSYLDLYDEVCPTASPLRSAATATTSARMSADALEGAPAS